MILDEVLAVGDAKFQEKCLNRISDIKKSGVTVLFVSHSAESVLQLCNKGILLHDGKLIGSGDAKEITGQYLRSLDLSHVDHGMMGIGDSRTGLLSGAATSLILKKLFDGSIANNCPIETPDGIIVVDVGWISASRGKTLRREPSWNGAPDLCVFNTTIRTDRERTLQTASDGGKGNLDDQAKRCIVPMQAARI